MSGRGESDFSEVLPGRSRRVDGTVLRVLDAGGAGRDWRAIVQDRACGNTVQLRLAVPPVLREGDRVSCEAELLRSWFPLGEEGVRLDIPAEFRVSAAHARGRLDVLSCSPRLRVTSPGPGEAAAPDGSRWIAELVPNGMSRDADVAWAARAFCEGGASALRGPVIVLDPAADYGADTSGLRSSAPRTAPALSLDTLPFLAPGCQEGLAEAARTGRAEASKLVDPGDHRRRPWGAIVGLPALHDPLARWRGFTGAPPNGAGLLPARYADPRSERRLCLAHELAHFHEEGMGLPGPSRDAGLSERFADCTAVMLFLRDGGDEADARLYADRRSAGLLFLDGPYACGPALRAAIGWAVERRWEGEHPPVTEVMAAALDIARSHPPPPPGWLSLLRRDFPGRDAPDLEEWAAGLDASSEGGFALDAVRGLLSSTLPQECGDRARTLLARAWSSMARDAERLRVGQLSSRLAQLHAGRERLGVPGEAEDGPPEAWEVPGRRHSPESHVVVAPAPDPILALSALAPEERLRLSREADDPARAGDAALSVLLDSEARSALGPDGVAAALSAWNRARSAGLDRIPSPA